MVDIRIEKQQAILRDRIGRFFANRARERQRLLQTLQTIKGFSGPAFIFGGVIRDLMLNGPSISPRDVDVVVGAVDLKDITAVFSENLTRRNRFGGLHLAIGGWHFDIWPLSQTWAFQKRIVPNATFESLPKTTFLNIEAVAVRLDSREWRYREIYSNGFFEALLSRTLEINSEPNPYPALCVLRSLMLAARLDFLIGPRLATYICEHARLAGIEELMQVQSEHYNQIYYDASTLNGWVSAIAKQRRLSKRSALELPHRNRQLPLIDIPNSAVDATRFTEKRKSSRSAWH